MIIILYNDGLEILKVRSEGWKIGRISVIRMDYVHCGLGVEKHLLTGDGWVRENAWSLSL